VTDAPVISINYIIALVLSVPKQYANTNLCHCLLVGDTPASLLRIIIDGYDGMEVGRIGIGLVSKPVCLQLRLQK